jgi:hypothetical protein
MTFLRNEHLALHLDVSAKNYSIDRKYESTATVYFHDYAKSHCIIFQEPENQVRI